VNAVACQRLVIWNTHAGAALRAAWLLEELAQDSANQICTTESREESIAQARQAADDGSEMVIAAGGDGTVNAVVNGLACGGGNTALAILPLGTGNDLCRTLAVPLNLRAALETLREDRRRTIDLARIKTAGGDFLYANAVTGGNSNRILENLTDEAKQRWGAWCYLRGAIDVLADLRGYKLTASFDDAPPREYSVWNVVVANGQTAGGGIGAAPHASLEDGRLDVILVLDGTPLDMASLSAGFLLSDYTQHHHVVTRQVKNASLEFEPESKILADGEPVVGNRFHFEVLPGALDVVVGEQYPK